MILNLATKLALHRGHLEAQIGSSEASKAGWLKFCAGPPLQINYSTEGIACCAAGIMIGVQEQHRQDQAAKKAGSWFKKMLPMHVTLPCGGVWQ